MGRGEEKLAYREPWGWVDVAEWSLNGAPESRISGSGSYLTLLNTGKEAFREPSLVHCV